MVTRGKSGDGLHGLRTLRLYCALFLCLFVAAWPSGSWAQTPGEGEGTEVLLTADDPAVQRIFEMQAAVTEEVMAIDGVVGIGTGLSETGQPALVILTRSAADRPRLPRAAEGVPVVYLAVGTPVPLSEAEPLSAGVASFRKTATYGTERAVRPVPIGISTGNWNQCAAGTIAARVKNGSDYFVLSCNHVFARINAAALGERILQPGRSEVACAQIVADTIGSLADFEPIVHLSTANNLMDAALVRTSPAFVRTGTPPDGYGIPSSTIKSAALRMKLQKYGKTTGLTKANVQAINVTLGLNYGYGTARFVNQIIAESNSLFVDVGDSGSLVVTDDRNNQPVGLVFARSGTNYTYINPIGPILQRFNVEIDNSNYGPLPVELTSFSGRLHDTDVRLNWNTATELNNFGFHVQRSEEQGHWEDIAFIAGAGTCATPRAYEHVDRHVRAILSGKSVQYRLLQIDRDGTAEYSAVVEIASRPPSVDLQIYPQPVRSNATVQLSFPYENEGTLSVYDAAGRRLDQLTHAVSASGGGMQVIPLSFSSAPPGRYFLEYRSSSGVLRKPLIVLR
jgi:hypothetical protein